MSPSPHKAEASRIPGSVRSPFRKIGASIMTERIETPCPACAEPVLVEAKKCKHCGVTISEATAQFVQCRCSTCAEMTDATLGRCTHCNEPLAVKKAQAAAVADMPTHALPSSASAQPWTAPRPAEPHATPLNVSFGQAIRLGFSKYATFEGRATRGEYWYFYLFFTCVIIVLQTPVIALALTPDDASLQIVAGISAVLYGVFSLATFLPIVGLGVRRMHDSGRSGWSQLWAFTVLGIPFVLWWLIKKGDERRNQYGDPRTR